MTGEPDGLVQWAQLTYASADSPGAGTPGGWRVQSVSATLSPADQDVLARGVTARLTDSQPISNFPSDTELAGRSRRMTHRHDAGRVALWHAVTAGADATGRPGNVFTHAAIGTPDGGRFRSIELWRSPDWLAPFGLQQVTDAALPTSLRRGDAVNRATTVRFLLEGDDAGFDSLLWLLDGVARSVEAGRTLVCLVEDADEAAQWVAAVSYLTSGGLGLALDWITFERANTLTHALGSRPHLVFVPRVDEALLPADVPDADLVDLAWELDGPVNGVWVFPSGLTYPTTRWHARALDLFSLPQTMALHVLEQLDDFQGEGAALHWPLSMALLCEPEAAFAHRLQLIEEVISETPKTAAGHPAVARLFGELEAADLPAPSLSPSRPGTAPPSPPAQPSTASDRPDPEPEVRRPAAAVEASVSGPREALPEIPGLPIYDPPPPTVAPPEPEPDRQTATESTALATGTDIERQMFAVYADVAHSRDAVLAVARCTAIAAGYTDAADIPRNVVSESPYLAAALLLGLAAHAEPERLLTCAPVSMTAWRHLTQVPEVAPVLPSLTPTLSMTAALEEALRETYERRVDGGLLKPYVQHDPDAHVDALTNLARSMPVKVRARMVAVACRSVALASNLPRSVFVISIEDTTLGESFAFACCAGMDADSRDVLDQQIRGNLLGSDRRVKELTSAVWSKIILDVESPISPRPASTRRR